MGSRSDTFWTFHGGIVRIPGIGGVIAPDFTLFPNTREIYREEDATVVVSKGLGAHSSPSVC